MPDREKVIRGLECIAHIPTGGTCEGCAYFRPFRDDPDTGWCDRVEAATDALALLREQEPLRPIFDELDVCGCCAVCGHSLTSQKMFGENVLLEERFDYCPKCGRAVKWDA